MRHDISSVDVRMAALALLAAGALVLAGCDPTETETLLGAPPEISGLRLVNRPTDELSVAPRQAVALRFSDDLDPHTVGPRSVRVIRPDGRRVRRLGLSARGSELLVQPPRGRPFPTGELLILQIEGRPSLRALRSVDGEPLVSRQEIAFRADGRESLDLTGPRLLASEPAAGTVDVAPGAHMALRFSEPLAPRIARVEGAVTLMVNGSPAPVRTRLSADGRVLVVRPVSPLPRAAEVEVLLEPVLVDVSGNPVEGVDRIRFHTRDSSLHEITEDFESADMADHCATTCSWASAVNPGFLVWGSGRREVGAEAVVEPLTDLGDRSTVHFQILYPADEIPAEGIASGLRLLFKASQSDGIVLAAEVRAGPSPLDRTDPTFAANEFAAALRTVASVTEPVDGEASVFDALGSPPRGAPALVPVEIPFDEPVSPAPGESVLVDVRLRLPPGVRLAAGSSDPDGRALVGGAPLGAILPAAHLLVSGGLPQARSLWYDSGSSAPDWRTAIVVGTGAPTGARIEYQSAPGDEGGLPDLDRASYWVDDLARIEPWRYVRFRVRFTGFSVGGQLPRLDRIVMPYVVRRR